jgi:hypothetical protein
MTDPTASSVTVGEPAKAADPAKVGGSDLLPLIVILQLVVIAGLVWALMQFGDLPDRVAQEVPQPFDNGAEIMQLQQSVDELSAKLDTLEARLSAQPSTAP